MNREGTGRIEYLDWTCNPIVGCTHGCPWCWARRQAKRQKHNCRKCYDFVPHLHPERLDEPLRLCKPSVIGVGFMGDLFDPALSSESVDVVVGTMHRAKQHTFVLLTKQPARAKGFTFPENLVLGVSVEDQPSADRLIPEHLKCQAAKHIVSIEPMREPVDLADGWLRKTLCYEHPALDGVILGGQTGPGAVPMHPDWVREVRDQCQEAGVPFYFKSWGEWLPADHHRWTPNEKDVYGRVFDHCTGRGMISLPGMKMYHVGRKLAGRTLDGRTHDETAWNREGKES